MIPVRLAFSSWRSRPSFLWAAFQICFLVEVPGALFAFVPPSSRVDEEASVFATPYRQPDPGFDLTPQARQKAMVFSRYYQGLTLERAGMIDAALDAYQKALKEAPQQQRLAYRASELAGQFRDIERGLAILEENYRLNPSEPDAYIRLSHYLATYHENRKDRIDRALAVLREAETKFPQNAKVCEQLVLALLLRQESAQAQAVLDKAIKQDVPKPDYWLQMARIASRIYRSEKGSGHKIVNELYEKALQLSNDDVQIGSQVGDYFRLTEQYDRAKDVYLRVIARHPEELDVREKLAAVYAIQGDQEKMLSTLLDLEKINPLRLETQKFIAQLYFKRNEWGKSIDHYLKAFRISQGTSKEYMVVARMLCVEKRPAEAIDLLKRARFHYPDELELTRELALAHSAAEDYATALKTFQDTEKLAEKVNPDLLNQEFYFSFGAAAERSKKFGMAEELFRKAIKLNTDDSSPVDAARPYNYLGYMWLEQDKNIEEAGELIQRANEINPGQGAYIDSLGWFYYKTGDFRKAAQTLLQAEKLLAEEGDKDAVVFDHIAQTFFKLGHKQRALDYLQKAIDLDSKNEEYRDRMKQFQEAQGLVPANLDFLDAKPSAEPGEDLPAKLPKVVEPVPNQPAQAK